MVRNITTGFYFEETTTESKLYEKLKNACNICSNWDNDANSDNRLKMKYVFPNTKRKQSYEKKVRYKVHFYFRNFITDALNCNP